MTPPQKVVLDKVVTNFISSIFDRVEKIIQMENGIQIDKSSRQVIKAGVKVKQEKTQTSTQDRTTVAVPMSEVITATTLSSRKRKESPVRSPDSSEPVVESEVKKLKLQKDFVAHPLSKGKDFRMLYSTCYRDHDMRQIKKRNENCSAELLPLMPKKPFFPNFVDPVPPNHKFAFEKKADKQSSVEITTSSQSHGIKEKKEAEINKEPESPVIDDEIKIILIIFFNNLCPKVIFKPMGCNEVGCEMIHKVPDAKHLESQLLKRSLKSAHTVYDFVLKFPLDLRNHFFPAFVEVGVRRNQESLLNKLMIDILGMKRLDGFNLFLDVMERHSWTKQKAIKFLIRHYGGSQSQSVLDEIVRVLT